MLNANAGMVAETFNGDLWLYLGISDCGYTFFQALGAVKSADNQMGVLTPLQALAIDSKMDDGVPATGNVFAHQPAFQVDGTIDNTPNQCVTDATSKVYNASNNSANWCRLMVRFP